MAQGQLMIAIDGPASSGKSVLGEALAQRLGYLYFDTGALYRAVTWQVLHLGIDVNDESAVARVTREASIAVCRPTVADGRQHTVLVDGEDITWGIVSPSVDAKVSIVAAYQTVRDELLEVQRQIAATGAVVMVGRDIGTVVVPNADLKIYLEATPEVRARRRHQQMAERGQSVAYEQVLENVLLRDGIDSGRTAAPLKVAADAVVIDTSAMSFAEELSRVLRLVEEKRASQTGPAD